MLLDLENLTEERLRALNSIEVRKKKIAKAYNKKVKSKAFSINDIVWKVILPLGTKDPKLGKWSPNWEGPFKVLKVIPGGAYSIQELATGNTIKSINGRFLKRYYTTLWETVQNQSS